MTKVPKNNILFFFISKQHVNLYVKSKCAVEDTSLSLYKKLY